MESVLYTAMDLNEFLTADKAANILKLSKAQIYYLVRIKEIPFCSWQNRPEQVHEFGDAY